MSAATTEYPVRLIRDDQLPAGVPWAAVRMDDDGSVYVFVKESAGSDARARALAEAHERWGSPVA